MMQVMGKGFAAIRGKNDMIRDMNSIYKAVDIKKCFIKLSKDRRCRLNAGRCRFPQAG